MSEMYMEQGRKRVSTLYDDPGTIGHSTDYMDGELRQREATAEAMSKANADAPVFSASQCAICKRGVQDNEPLVRGKRLVAHARCVRALVDLINAGRPKVSVQEPNMDTIRSIQKSIDDDAPGTKHQIIRGQHWVSSDDGNTWRKYVAGKRVLMSSSNGTMRKSYLSNVPASVFSSGDTPYQKMAKAEAYLQGIYQCSELRAYGITDDEIVVWMDEDCRKRHGIP